MGLFARYSHHYKLWRSTVEESTWGCDMRYRRITFRRQLNTSLYDDRVPMITKCTSLSLYCHHVTNIRDTLIVTALSVPQSLHDSDTVISTFIIIMMIIIIIVAMHCNLKPARRCTSRSGVFCQNVYCVGAETTISVLPVKILTTALDSVTFVSEKRAIIWWSDNVSNF